MPCRSLVGVYVAFFAESGRSTSFIFNAPLSEACGEPCWFSCILCLYWVSFEHLLSKKRATSIIYTFLARKSNRISEFVRSRWLHRALSIIFLPNRKTTTRNKTPAPWCFRVTLLPSLAVGQCERSIVLQIHDCCPTGTRSRIVSGMLLLDTPGTSGSVGVLSSVSSVHKTQP
jgi:hypothetical protein